MDEVEDTSILKTGHAAAIDDLYLVTAPAAGPPRSGLSRSDLVPWPISVATADGLGGRFLG